MGDFMNNIVYTTEITRYAFFEKRSPSAFTRVCIDGHITGSNKCVGYCQYQEHSGFLTTELLTQHDCIKKGCDYFIAKPKYKDTAKEHDDMSLTILSHAQNIFSHNEGVKILGVKNTGFNSYSIEYITITNEYSLEDYVNLVYNLFGIEVAFVKLNYDFDVCVELICTN